ncbi:alpha/beta-hydrolase [Gyrodon lividus]|nr:alpha/beta-hydrolase [Gyrodon lividus]
MVYRGCTADATVRRSPTERSSAPRKLLKIMELIEYLDIPYIPSEPQNPFHTFDIYVPKHLQNASHNHNVRLNLVCFVHGGAWRSEDKADYAGLARKLAISTGYPVAAPNYRLTPGEPTTDNCPQHPEHARDVLRFFEFVRSWYDGNSNTKGFLPCQPRKLFFVGHSCAAHILCTIFLRMSGETLHPSDELVQSTAAIMMSEGIYDIDLLLSSFPTYRAWFIESTFGAKDSYEDVSAIKATMNPKGDHIRWLIIHSQGDTLVDERQSSAMYIYLRETSHPVTKTFDELGDEHNTILQGPRYVEIINNYIKGVVEGG